VHVELHTETALNKTGNIRNGEALLAFCVTTASKEYFVTEATMAGKVSLLNTEIFVN